MNPRLGWLHRGDAGELPKVTDRRGKHLLSLRHLKRIHQLTTLLGSEQASVVVATRPTLIFRSIAASIHNKSSVWMRCVTMRSAYQRR